MTPNGRGPEDLDRRPGEPEPSLTDKVKKKVQDFDVNEKLEDIYSYSASHKEETIAYIILLFGLILALFGIYWGYLLVGLVVGYYFSEKFAFLATHYSELVAKYGQFRMYILGGGLLALFIAAPLFFIGVLFIVALKEWVLKSSNTPPR